MENSKPLPYGPIHLIWFDVAIVGFILLLTLVFPVINPWIVIAAFLAAYAAGLFLSFLLTDQADYIAAYLVLAPLCVYPHLDIRIAIVVLFGLVGIGLWGIRSYLREFPWNTAWWNKNMIEHLKRDAIKRRIIQWPFPELGPRNLTPLTLGEAAFLVLLISWWIHVIEWIARKEDSSNLFLYPIAILAMVLIRHLRYIGNYRSPITLFGRICTGRIIYHRGI